MKVRILAFALAGTLIPGCSGINHFVPAAPEGPAAVAPDTSKVDALMRIRIPRRNTRRRGMHPSTISPLTNSVAVTVNTAKTQLFNTTPTSAGCTEAETGTTCTFAVHAPAGIDSFTVTTYSGINATGAALDRGIAAKIPIFKGKANKVAIALGPLVTTTADSGIGSLRYAVATATSGDTITFALPNGATIVLASKITIIGNVTIAGPGAADLTISGAGTHQLFLNAGTATISGLTLAHGKAATPSSPGGAIENAGSLTLAGDVVGSSSSIVAIRRAPKRIDTLKTHGLHPHCTSTTAEGGAIYNNGALAISSTTFTGNVAPTNIAGCLTGEGGAIFNDTLGTLSSSHDTYAGNSAALGGAVYSVGAGGVSFTTDTFTGNTGCTASSGCPTTGCGASSCTSSAIGEGAAIYDGGTGIAVNGSTFTGNVAGGKTAGSVGQGGAIFLNSAIPTITNSTFTSNLAGGGTSSCSQGLGGAIYSVNAIEIDNDAFKSNSASGDTTSGGGAVVGAAALSGTGDTFTGNTVVASGGPCTTSAQALGGAAFGGTTVTFTNSTFGANTATGQAAGAGGALGGDTVMVTNCTFSTNAATGTGSAGATGTTGGGGALYVITLAKVTGSTFSSNAATAESSVAQAAIGGGIVVATGSLISSGNTFTSNSATMKTATFTAAGGGIAVISSSSGELVSSNDKFTSNSVAGAGTAGGGAVLSAYDTYMSNVTMTSNTATGATGAGGALAVGTTATLSGILATGNTATGTAEGAGGALYDGAGATIENSTFAHNTANLAGGGIFSLTNPETIVESTVNDNAVTNAKAASMGGGGLYDTAGLTLVFSSVNGNTVTVSGPGPDGGGGIISAGPLMLLNSTVSSNKVLGSAPQSGGGAIIAGQGIIATNSTISNNSSSLDAGGLYYGGSSGAAFTNVTFFKNSATGHGGNILNIAGGMITLTNSVVGGGTAATGPDIDNAGTITSGDYNVIQTLPAGTALTGTTTHDLYAAPNLLPLTNNGGPTLTNADQSTSPGRARIPYSGSACNGVSLTEDQRGFTRGSGGHCDAGAYEYAGVVTAIARRPVVPHQMLRHKTRGNRSPLFHLKAPKIDLQL